jgi:hypothetical protein
MKRIMVRYKVKPERADENEALIRDVFTELAEKSPEGLSYASFKLDDGVSFVHVASIDTSNGSNPLADTAAFKAFQAEIKDRCDEPPKAVELNTIGAYRFFDG